MNFTALISIRERWQKSVINRSLAILPQVDQRKVLIITFVQSLVGILDLLGVVAIGLLGAISVTGLQAQQPGERASAALSILHISDAPFQTQALILGTLALFLLVGRTMLSIFFTRKTLYFLSRRGAKISANLVSRLLSQPLLTIQARTTQETAYSLTIGVQFIVINVLAGTIVLISDLMLLTVLTIGLFIVDPITAIGTLFVFGIVGFSLHRLMNVRASALGVQNSSLSIKCSEKIVEVFTSYRESVVRNRRDYYAREIGKIRYELADAIAEQNFMPYISKYVLETSVIIGAMLISATQFVLQDANHAVATLAIFLAAGTRIAPAVLRVQQGAITIRGGIGAAAPTLDLVEILGQATTIENVDDSVDVLHEGFEPEIHIKNVSLTYPGKTDRAISQLTLTIPAGTSVAFVGTSGAGKTTIIDVLLGVLTPDEGDVLISGKPPLLAVAKWPGAVSYVPQDVVVASGSIRENVALGYPTEAATDDLVMAALRVANLDQFALDLPNGIDTQVGERGTQLSGGQRQRLGIARAMFTRPHLLVLDEATSSLDGGTEANISEAIHALRGSTTVVMIAHRLSTVRNADIVVYLSNGKIQAMGSFDEIRTTVPDFDHQAKLMGL